MPPFAIFMLIFAGCILLYAAILAVTKDRTMLPLKVQVSLKGKSKQYIFELSKAVAVTALAPAAAGILGIWNEIAAIIGFLAGLVFTLWLGTRIMKDVK